MSYEVYIDVVHHPKHCDDFEQKEDWCVKSAMPYETEAERMAIIAATLRDFADHIDPDWHCTHCKQARSEHVRQRYLYRCFNQYGPITQWAWWAENAIDAASSSADASSGASTPASGPAPS